MATKTEPLGGTGHWDYLIVDPDNRRLYVSHNSEVVVINVDTQEIVGKITVDGFSRGIANDPGTKLAFSSNRDGTLTDVGKTQRVSTVLQTAKTEVGARTMALDTKTHKVYLPSAEFGPKPAGSNYPSVVPGSFKV